MKKFISVGLPSFVKDEKLKPFVDRRTKLTVYLGCIMYGFRVVPGKLQNLLLDELHEGQPGNVRSYVWWPSLEADLECCVRSCVGSQEQQATPCKAPLHPWSWSTAPWQHVHVDFAGPFLNTMFLVVLDAHLK